MGPCCATAGRQSISATTRPKRSPEQGKTQCRQQYECMSNNLPCAPERRPSLEVFVAQVSLRNVCVKLWLNTSAWSSRIGLQHVFLSKRVLCLRGAAAMPSLLPGGRGGLEASKCKCSCCFARCACLGRLLVKAFWVRSRRAVCVRHLLPLYCAPGCPCSVQAWFMPARVGLPAFCLAQPGLM